MGDGYVIDASVAVKIFQQEDHSDNARRLIDLVKTQAHPVYVPDVFFAECANVFRTWIRLKHMSPEKAGVCLGVLAELPLERLPSETILASALSIAVRFDLTAYDAIYVALARNTRSALVTADKAILRNVRGPDYEVVSIAEWRG
ncbi:type II toxin-antitoxin system VapC family toxin [bacterium]|nr:type II toxin-antitoxin system VapC family toxin [bacterium]